VTTSSNGGLQQAIRDRVDKSVKNLPDARARAEVSYQLSFVNADRAHESTPIASAN
jgi:hypothetical protein